MVGIEYMTVKDNNDNNSEIIIEKILNMGCMQCLSCQLCTSLRFSKSSDTCWEI